MASPRGVPRRSCTGASPGAAGPAPTRGGRGHDGPPGPQEGRGPCRPRGPPAARDLAPPRLRPRPAGPRRPRGVWPRAIPLRPHGARGRPRARDGPRGRAGDPRGPPGAGLTRNRFPREFLYNAAPSERTHMPERETRPCEDVLLTTSARLPTRYGTFRIHAFVCPYTGEEHVALVKGAVARRADVP